MALVWRNIFILVFAHSVVSGSQIHRPTGCGKPTAYPDKQLRDKYRQKSVFDNEESVFYTCAPGYTLLEGSRESKCESGRWTTLNMKCQKKKCNGLGDIENGQYIREGQSFGDKAIAVCNKGYVLRGEKVRMCTEIGWNGTDPICEVSKIICSAPAVANGQIKPGERTQYAPQDTVNIVCSEGFDLTGSPQVTCGPDGQWQALPECRPQVSKIICSAPAVANGQIKPGERTQYAPQDTVNIVCSEGFDLTGSPQVTCGPDGQWQALPECRPQGRIAKVFNSRVAIPKTCLTPNLGKNGTVNEQKSNYKPGESISVTCNEGFVGSGVFTCQETSKWHPKKPKCQSQIAKVFNSRVVIPKTCLTPNLGKNGTVNEQKSNYMPGESISVTCNEGFVGSGVFTCNETSKWHPKKPKCQSRIAKVFNSRVAIPKTCLTPNLGKNGTVNEQKSNYMPGESISVTCNEGFVGSGVFTCNETSKWHPKKPKCQSRIAKVFNSGVAIPKTCLTPNLGKNGTVNEQKSNYKPGESISVTCNEGFVGSGVFTCQETSKWHPKKPKCQMITCSAPTVANGRISPGSRVYKSRDTVDVICNEGFDLIGSPQVTCGPDGQWQALPECRPKVITCSAPTVANGRISPGSRVYKSRDTVDVICNEGFDLIGSPQVTCGPDGQWQALPECRPKVITCSAPTVANGRISPGSRVYKSRDTVDVICNEGFDLIGSPQVTCGPDGQWQALPECRPKVITCSAPTVANGRISPGSRVYKSRDTVDVICNEGFDLIGSPQVTCGPDGQWQALPECRPKRISGKCGPAPLYPQAFPRDGSSTLKEYPPGARIPYKCSVGYMRTRGSFSIYCRNGQWTNLELQCERKKCGSAEEISNGQYRYTGVSFGDSATAVCQEGYELVGPKVRICRDGGWDGRSPVCEPVHCPPPPEVKDAEMSDPIYDHVPFGHVLSYQCRTGALIGAREIYCTESGTWSAPPPECKNIVCPNPRVPGGSRMRGFRTVYKYGNTVIITCNPGLSLLGESFVTCGPDGQWNPKLPECM